MKSDVSRKYRSDSHARMVPETLLRIDYSKVATAEQCDDYEPDEAAYGKGRLI